jgi:peptidoglycan/LPS O-acetylase OafA/YrhL
VRDRVRSGTESLDGLRGVAILLVLGYHTWLFSWLTPALALGGVAIPVDAIARAGYLGVELFFTISGFVLFFPQATRALANEPQQDLGTFALRRALKIVPSYALALAATFVSLASFQPPAPLLPTLATHLTFVHSFWDDPLGPANSVFWSLAIEAQFYVVFPAVAWAFRRRPLATATGMILLANAYRFAVAGCCLAREPVFRELPAFLDTFACGMLAAYGVAWGRARLAESVRIRAAATVGALAFASLGVALLLSANGVTYVTLGRERWTLAHRTLVAIASGGLAFCSCFAFAFWRRLLANPLFVFCSLISYNLYLWHTLVLIAMKQHRIPDAATHDVIDDPQWKLAYVALGLAASVAVASATTYFLERPLLALAVPQPFAFDYAAFARRLGFTRASAANARRGTRT